MFLLVKKNAGKNIRRKKLIVSKNILTSIVHSEVSNRAMQQHSLVISAIAFVSRHICFKLNLAQVIKLVAE